MSDNEVIVSINNGEEKVIADELRASRDIYKNMTHKQELTGDEMNSLLNELVNNKLLLMEAKKRDYKVDEKELERHYKAFEERMQGKEKMDEALKKHNVDKAQFMRGIENDILIEMIVEDEVKKKVNITDEEVKEFFDNNEIKRPHQIGLQHIFLPVTSDEEESVAGKMIHDIYKKVKKKKGKNFVKLVKEYSQCETKDRDGIIGYITQNSVEPVVWESIKDLKVGEFTEPVRSQSGFHVFRILNFKEEGEASLEEAEKDIKLHLMKSKIRDYLKKYVFELKQEKKIDIDEDLFNKVLSE